MKAGAEPKEPTWSDYFEKTRARGQNPLSMAALDAYYEYNPEEKDIKVLDGGCGAGGDTKYFLDQKCYVTAVDPEARALEIVEERAQEIDANSRLTCQQSGMQDYSAPNAYDIVISIAALPFVPPGSFKQAWFNIEESLCVGGIFAGQFFGNEHAWAQQEPEKSTMTFHTEEGLKLLLEEGFEVISWETTKDLKRTKFQGEQMFHMFDIVARRIGQEQELLSDIEGSALDMPPLMLNQFVQSQEISACQDEAVLNPESTKTMRSKIIN